MVGRKLEALGAVMIAVVAPLPFFLAAHFHSCNLDVRPAHRIYPAHTRLQGGLSTIDDAGSRR